MHVLCEYALKLAFGFLWWKQVGNHVADH